MVLFPAKICSRSRNRSRSWVYHHVVSPRSACFPNVYDTKKSTLRRQNGPAREFRRFWESKVELRTLARAVPSGFVLRRANKLSESAAVHTLCANFKGVYKKPKYCRRLRNPPPPPPLSANCTQTPRLPQRATQLAQTRRQMHELSIDRLLIISGTTDQT